MSCTCQRQRTSLLLQITQNPHLRYIFVSEKERINKPVTINSQFSSYLMHFLEMLSQFLLHKREGTFPLIVSIHRYFLVFKELTEALKILCYDVDGAKEGCHYFMSVWLFWAYAVENGAHNYHCSFLLLWELLKVHTFIYSKM